MIYLTVALLGVVVLLLVLREREGVRLARERQSLLDRIQHPQRRPAAAADNYERPETPKDAGQLAQIGQIVPDGVEFGAE